MDSWSRTKFRTSPDTVTSWTPDFHGKRVASPVSKWTRGSPMRVRAWDTKPSDESIPQTDDGAHASTMVEANAPVPQPTSAHARRGAGASQRRNSVATRRLQRPTYCSYARPESQASATGLFILHHRYTRACQ